MGLVADIFSQYLTHFFALFISPSVFVWKEERGAASLIGGRRPRCESWGSRASTFNFSVIIESTPCGSTATSWDRREYFEYFLCLPTSSHHCFSLWNLIFNNTAFFFFLFINWRYSRSDLRRVTYWTFLCLGWFLN